MGEEHLSEPYVQALRRGFEFARALAANAVRSTCSLASPGQKGPSRRHSGQTRDPRSDVVASAAGANSSPAYLHLQAQGAARSFAAGRRQRLAPEHLLVEDLRDQWFRLRTAGCYRGEPRPENGPVSLL